MIPCTTMKHTHYPVIYTQAHIKAVSALPGNIPGGQIGEELDTCAYAYYWYAQVRAANPVTSKPCKCLNSVCTHTHTHMNMHTNHTSKKKLHTCTYMCCSVASICIYLLLQCERQDQARGQI